MSKEKADEFRKNSAEFCVMSDMPLTDVEVDQLAKLIELGYTNDQIVDMIVSETMDEVIPQPPSE